MDTRECDVISSVLTSPFDREHSVDAARYGIETLAPQFFNGAKPDFVVSGPNIGSESPANCLLAKSLRRSPGNLGLVVLLSGTVCVL